MEEQFKAHVTTLEAAAESYKQGEPVDLGLILATLAGALSILSEKDVIFPDPWAHYGEDL